MLNLSIRKCGYLNILVCHNFQRTPMCASIVIETATDVCDFPRISGEPAVTMETYMLAMATRPVLLMFSNGLFLSILILKRTIMMMRRTLCHS